MSLLLFILVTDFESVVFMKIFSSMTNYMTHKIFFIGVNKKMEKKNLRATDANFEILKLIFIILLLMTDVIFNINRSNPFLRITLFSNFRKIRENAK